MFNLIYCMLVNHYSWTVWQTRKKEKSCTESEYNIKVLRQGQIKVVLSM